jgi:hypothetical protein
MIQKLAAILAALLLVGVAFLLVGPSQPWYGLLIVALAVLADRPAWLAVAAAAYPVYQAGNLGTSNTGMQQWSYLTAAAVVAAVYGFQRVRSATRLRISVDSVRVP